MASSVVNTKMEKVEESFSLALSRIKEVLSEEAYSYLVGVLQETEEQLTEESPSRKASVVPRTRRQRADLLTSLGASSDSSLLGLHINLSSLQPRTRGSSSVQNDILCSRLPACKKFLNKTMSEGVSRPSSVHLKRKESRADCKPSDLAPIAGRITYPATEPFIAPSKGPAGREKKVGKGVCEMHQSISNPLYKNYNPEGYIKSEDELGRDLISQFTQAFNTWLESLQGQKLQVQPELFFKILRQDLDVPDPELLRAVEKLMGFKV